jgi:hypothetical protein
VESTASGYLDLLNFGRGSFTLDEASSHPVHLLFMTEACKRLGRRERIGTVSCSINLSNQPSLRLLDLLLHLLSFRRNLLQPLPRLYHRAPQLCALLITQPKRLDNLRHLIQRQQKLTGYGRGRWGRRIDRVELGGRGESNLGGGEEGGEVLRGFPGC